MNELPRLRIEPAWRKRSLREGDKLTEAGNAKSGPQVRQPRPFVHAPRQCVFFCRQGYWSASMSYPARNWTSSLCDQGFLARLGVL